MKDPYHGPLPKLEMELTEGNKMAAVRPWATGLSGQLQKAFVTGVPKLNRLELEAACEDFSNVISSSSIGTVYKGTLSNGVEIAVTSVAATSPKDWSKNLEAQFRNKIDSLSNVNHKNFVNLLGYCVEKEPSTRMLVFEYAPNGTLFEHLHIKEAEHLDWGTRMRITTGMAYCLEHMHQLTPPIAHKNLNSTSINLTEDYAVKISDFGFWIESAEAEMVSYPECNVYSFGVILFEMVTGRPPYSSDSCSLKNWASDYLRGEQPLVEMLDPTLKSFQVEQLEQIGEVIKSCVTPNPKERPQMREVTARLREITMIGPDAAVPKLSPFWWAELEIISTEAR
ncbi:Inactive receptor-like serine/threonine-protein kinase [Camellia lanceoleosa]|uniref:Inactive receptor-like serine/threonine-protein kinase n=1 Tax=Camellia lanceoleosa TaxID=1840588 RepID=A0ACC0H7S7_9ERIC|nr:Inactive receptor-like serine/threonine-protein kinase [Camellia lanceoleosa]